MPVPVDVVPLGFWVNVHVPVAGKPVKVTLPVARLQVGCVGVPTEGAVGGLGTALITISEVGQPQVQPASFITLYV